MAAACATLLDGYVRRPKHAELKSPALSRIGKDHEALHRPFVREHGFIDHSSESELFNEPGLRPLQLLFRSPSRSPHVFVDQQGW